MLTTKDLPDSALDSKLRCWSLWNVPFLESQDEVAGLREAMAARLLELEGVVEAKVADLTESSGKNVQLGARVRLVLVQTRLHG